MKNYSSILLDIQKEVSGSLISDTFTVDGRSYKMQLLTESESAWVFSLVQPRNSVALALSVRLGNLAIGIRSIDDVPINLLVAEAYDRLTEDEKIFRFSDVKPQFIDAELFYEYLSDLPGEFIGKLHECWQKLELRRSEAQAELKNSFGESSQKDMSEDSIELSPPGEQ